MCIFSFVDQRTSLGRPDINGQRSTKSRISDEGSMAGSFSGRTSAVVAGYERTVLSGNYWLVEEALFRRSMGDSTHCKPARSIAVLERLPVVDLSKYTSGPPDRCNDNTPRKSPLLSIHRSPSCRTFFAVFSSSHKKKTTISIKPITLIERVGFFFATIIH